MTNLMLVVVGYLHER